MSPFLKENPKEDQQSTQEIEDATKNLIEHVIPSYADELSQINTDLERSKTNLIHSYHEKGINVIQ